MVRNGEEQRGDRRCRAVVGDGGDAYQPEREMQEGWGWRRCRILSTGYQKQVGSRRGFFIRGAAFNLCKRATQARFENDRISNRSSSWTDTFNNIAGNISAICHQYASTTKHSFGIPSIRLHNAFTTSNATDSSLPPNYLPYANAGTASYPTEYPHAQQLIVSL
ncbi:hypothetical protein NE237_021020 [Protea cynaroides]|uniref:Uncharacterized protein n=1 Tax=Protea cynaroides TaxID=273540 RepID=A0A9Q0H8C2_9MAGN|nr:hypothetical protein NE237_021020 [Protea cynaroides]